MKTEFEKNGYRIVSGGTDNHLILVDLRPKGLTGNVTEKALESVGIILNRNVIPYDAEKPDIASGIRIGSPAITSRGMGETEVIKIVELIDTALMNRENIETLSKISTEVLSLCKQFPINKE